MTAFARMHQAAKLLMSTDNAVKRIQRFPLRRSNLYTSLRGAKRRGNPHVIARSISNTSLRGAKRRGNLPHQILPSRIHRINKRILPPSTPRLYLLLPSNCLTVATIPFRIHEFPTLISGCKSSFIISTVFDNPTLKIVSNTGI